MPLRSTLDLIDIRILGALQANPRAGILAIAREAGIARNTAQAHLDRMIASGVIAGFGPEIDLRAIGYRVSAFVSLEIAQGKGERVEQALVGIPEVIAAWMATGPSDLLCQVVARDSDHLGEVLGQILGIGGVVRTTTSLLLATRIAPRSLHLATQGQSDPQAMG